MYLFICFMHVIPRDHLQLCSFPVLPGTVNIQKAMQLSCLISAVLCFLVSEPGFFELAGTFDTFRYQVGDWEELGPNNKTSRYNLSHGMGFDGRGTLP